MIKSVLLFLLGSLILFGFLPIINQLAIESSERLEFIEIIIPAEQTGLDLVLTESQIDALIKLFTGNGFSLKIITPNETYVLIDNFQLVDPDHSINIFFQTNILFRQIKDKENNTIISFTTSPDINYEPYFDYFNEFIYLDEQITLIYPNEYAITIVIALQETVAPLLNLLPILAVIIFTSLAVVYIKFK